MIFNGRHLFVHGVQIISQTVFYARVSTSDQTLDHQIDQARSAGFEIDQVVSDHGVSGVSTKLSERPEGKRLFDILRHGDQLVVRWVDRLGRNYQDVTDTIRKLMRRGIVVRTVINNMTFDGSTTDPMQEAVRDALIGFMAASAQAQAEVQKEAQRAGVEAAKGSPHKYRGKKPSYTKETLAKVSDALGQGVSVSQIARDHNISRQTVIRIRSNPTGAMAAMDRWGL